MHMNFCLNNIACDLLDDDVPDPDGDSSNLL